MLSLFLILLSYSLLWWVGTTIVPYTLKAEAVNVRLIITNNYTPQVLHCSIFLIKFEILSLSCLSLQTQVVQCNNYYMSAFKIIRVNILGIKNNFWSHSFTLTEILLDNFTALIFSNHHFLDPNEQIWPIRPLHLAKTALIAPKAHWYWIYNDMEKW